MALVNIYVTGTRVCTTHTLQSRIRGGTLVAPVRPALKSGTATLHHCKKWYGVRRTYRTFYVAPVRGIIARPAGTIIEARRQRIYQCSDHSVDSQIFSYCCTLIDHRENVQNFIYVVVPTLR